MVVGMPLSSGIAIAQVTPDSSLNTQVESQDNIFNITGGTTAGNNLFHSFSGFSIPQGSEAFFNNSPGLNNIISRVTGGNLSDIQGSIRSAGTANFFLINPAGIVFGESASLNVGGSFFATTGDRLLFADGIPFDATTATPPPLLSMSVPAGLQTGINPGSIINRSRTPNAMGEVRGLQVQPTQALVLVGGEVQMEGGFLNSISGSVNVGSVGSNGTVLFAPTATGLSLDYSGATEFRNITFSNQAGIDTSGPRSGGIELQGDVLQFTGGSTVTAATIGEFDGGAIALTGRQILVNGDSSILTATTGTGRGADITVQASEMIELAGESYERLLQSILSDLSDQIPAVDASQVITTATTGDGDSGSVTLMTQQLRLLDGVALGSSTNGAGDAGDLIIRTSESFEAVGSLLGSVATAGPTSTGDGGNVVIETPNLVLRDGTLISGTTTAGGQGGNISITADRVELSDSRTTLPPVPPIEVLINTRLTGINSVTLSPARAGDITINARIVELSNGANIRTNSVVNFTEFAGPSGRITINASDYLLVQGVSPEAGLPTIINTGTDTRSPANDITLNVGQLLVRDGGILESGTSGTMAGGQILINATDRIEVTGSGFSPFFQQSRPSSITSASFSEPTNPFPASGDAGNIIITAPTIFLGDGGLIAVSSTALGGSGNLDLTTDSLQLNQGGSINGSTAGGDGGQLFIRVGDRLSLTDQSEITSTAGTDAVGQSGNIEISADSLSLNNSVIAANSQSPNSQGGSISIALEDGFESNNGRIEATTVSTNGGDIQLRANRSFVLRNNSLISTTAGVEGTGGGDGGNIQISSPVVVAFPTENSDITANAFTGDGGSIQIQADTILGLQPRSSPTAFSDITASSEFGLSGEITITDFTVEPDRGLLGALPTLLDASQIVVLGCSDTEDNQFVATGRGGIPPNPSQLVESDRPWQDLRDLSGFQQAVGSGDRSRSFAPTAPVEWPLEARGWQQTDSGATVLSAAMSSSDPTLQASNRKCLAKS